MVDVAANSGAGDLRVTQSAGWSGIGRKAVPAPAAPRTSSAVLWLIVTLAVVSGALIGFGAMYYVGGGIATFGP